VERRVEPRFASEAPVVLVLPSHRQARSLARLRNVSQSGVCLETAVAVAPGSLVRIEFEDDVAEGSVATCREAAGYYHLGIRLHRPLPAPLLNPAAVPSVPDPAAQECSILMP
jgi:hypothetical protein